MTAPKAKSLVEKIAAACDKVGAVPKRGRNEGKDYPYQKASDVAAALRHHLFFAGVLLLADESEPKFARIETNGGGFLTEAHVAVDYELTDGKESIEKRAYGIAWDDEDKALYKAKTGALKYFLRGLGLIPDEKDDPEYEDRALEQEFADNPDRRPPKRLQPVAEFQINGFNEAWTVAGRTEEQKITYLRTRFGVEKVEELKRKDFAIAIREISGTANRPKAIAGAQGKMFPAPVPVEITSGQRIVVAADPKAFAL
jgi:ERF superfamily